MSAPCTFCDSTDPAKYRLAGHGMESLYCWDCADERCYPQNTAIVPIDEED